MTIKNVLITIVLAALVSYGVVTYTSPHTNIENETNTDETVYERVMRNGKIRCGYNFYEPGFMKNEQTGEFSGLYYDLIMKMGELLDVEIEWTSLTGWGNMVADLNAGKIDAFCISVWPNALRGKRAIVTDPFLYMNVEAYGHADETKYDSNLARVNNEDTTIAIIDSDITSEIASSEFPKANVLAVGHLESDDALFSQIEYGKADVTFTTHSIFIGYNNKNPGVVKRLAPNSPLRTFGTTILIPMGEHNFKAMLDTAIGQMVNSGDVKRILSKYTADYPNTFFMPSRPYDAPESSE